MAKNGHGVDRYCLGINISMEAKRATDRIASEKGISRCAILRRALYQYLEAHEEREEDLLDEVGAVRDRAVDLRDQGMDVSPIVIALGSEPRGNRQKGRPPVVLNRDMVHKIWLEGIPLRESARALGVSRHVLGRNARDYGLPFTRTRFMTRRRVGAFRKKGLQWKEIARELRVNPNTLLKARQKWGMAA